MIHKSSKIFISVLIPDSYEPVLLVNQTPLTTLYFVESLKRTDSQVSFVRESTTLNENRFTCYEPFNGFSVIVIFTELYEKNVCFHHKMNFELTYKNSLMNSLANVSNTLLLFIVSCDFNIKYSTLPSLCKC